MRLLIEDTAGLPIDVLAEAVRQVGAEMKRFPTAGHINEAGRAIIAERAADRRIASALALPAPSGPDDAEREAVAASLAALKADLDRRLAADGQAVRR